MHARKTGPITIAIADDHPVVGQGLGCTLAAEYSFILMWVATGIEQLQEKMQIHVPDVLVLDVIMPGVKSIEGFTSLIKQYPDLNIVAYTSLNSPTLVNMLYKIGVKAFINKSHPISELVMAMQKAAKGEIHIPLDLSEVVKFKFQADIQDGLLTHREQEVLEMIAAEKSSAEIAAAIGISLNTVEFHRKKLFEKFGVKNVAGLVRAAIAQGFIS